MSTARNGSPTNDSNILKVTAREIISIKPFARAHSLLLDTGQTVEFCGYDLEQVLCCILDEYGEEFILEKIKNL